MLPFVNQKKTIGVGFDFQFARNHEVFYSVTNNKRDYYRSDEDYVQKEIAAAVNFQLRPKLF